MNNLEKIFSSIRNAPSKDLKEYSTRELIKQLREYEEYMLYTLKNVFALLTSENQSNRVAGAKILNFLNFEYEINFSVESKNRSDYVYLQFKEIENFVNEDVDAQRKAISKTLSIPNIEKDIDFIDNQELISKSIEIKHKTTDYVEKVIENIYDFFDALSLQIVSPDWHKRHGAFLGFSAIVCRYRGLVLDITPQDILMEETKYKSRTKISIKGDIFNLVFEILKNDKFNDFQDDITSCPVREVSSLLLFYSFPLLNNGVILYEISNLLTSKDWQEQLSGLISLSYLRVHLTSKFVNQKAFQNDSLIDILIKLIESPDEDVKYASADILSYIFEKDMEFEDTKINSEGSLGKVQQLAEACWNQIQDEIDIAFSKASLIILYKIVNLKYKLKVPEDISCLYPCFTSNNQLIKNSVLEISAIFTGEEFLYLLAESILLNCDSENYDSFASFTDSCYKMHLQIDQKMNLAMHFKNNDRLNKTISILEDKFKNKNLEAFSNSFLEIISKDANKEYSADDFACYTENFFTRDGIKFIGYSTSMDNRIILLSLLIKLGFKSKGGVLGESYFLLQNMYNLKLSNITSDENILNDKNENNIIDFNMNDVLIEEFKKYNYTKIPMKEIKGLIKEPLYDSSYPLCYEYCLDFIRLQLIKDIDNPDLIYKYFIMETSIEFLKMICLFMHKTDENLRKIYAQLISLCKERTRIYFESMFKTETYRSGMVNQGIRNIKFYFCVLGVDIYGLNAFKEIAEDENRILFYEECISIYLIYCRSLNESSSSNTNSSLTDQEITYKRLKENLEDVFNLAFENKNANILRHFLREDKYNIAYVKRMLESFDVDIFKDLIEYSNPIYNVLFLKLILKSMHIVKPGRSNIETDDSSKNNDLNEVLGRIICSLHFNSKSSDEYLNSLIEIEKKDAEMLIDSKNIPEYELKLNLDLELREYQKHGIKWMAFLNRFNMNGILADDMGLGKTIQVLYYAVSELKSRNSQSSSCIKSDKILILCPSSLLTHWKDELSKYFQLGAVIYTSKVSSIDQNFVICSYDTFRRDGNLVNHEYFMVIFDEGHIFKNRSTVLYSKISLLKSEHKFILTGTPVHNSVEDLFSLFEVIMPGYLGSESEFTSNYSCKINDKNLKVMEKRLQDLHKKTLPFIMRRLKSEVLNDLPPKIIKDLMVEMNQEQMKLYKEYESEENVVDDEDSKLVKTVGYQLLRQNGLTKTRNLLKIAAHPHFFDEKVESAKTQALIDLFGMCEGKKILIFFQFKKTIEYVITELEKKSILSNNYLRLDGSITTNLRGGVVSRFNNEYNFNYLFLTTSIGGLGLNLTASDTVIFYEHDWNPFNDLQAMDRAHRLGQKNVVNVFRLICRDTIEEKVMNYQNFKLHVANSIVTQQNNEIETMDTKDILERFL